MERRADEEIVVVLVTAPGTEAAAAIARTLVEERLAACGNVVSGIRSIYAWEGRVQDEPEALLILKTPRGRLEALTERVRALHSYSVPEVIALPVLGGSEPYLGWVRESTG